MFSRNLFFFICFFVFNSQIYAQYIPLNRDLDYYYESAFNFDSSYHYTVKPFTQDYSRNTEINKLNTENSILNKIFNDDLINIRSEKMNLSVNPIINSVFYNDFSEKTFFKDYKAGINFKSSFKNKLFLNSSFFVAQTSFTSFYDFFIDRYEIVPNYGKYIRNNASGLTYYSWTGDITYKANENISFTAGRGKNFLGNGYRSLFLSDNSNAYPYFKAEVNVRKIKYLWMFSGLSDVNISKDANPLILYDKAAFTHYFSLNITKRINFDFFETIITNPFDSEGRRISYDAVYFNPVIFYRPAEFYKGSSDNSLMGIGLNIRLFKSAFLYSQFILDDLIISSLRDGSGWWGNKFGMQAGFKSYNLLNVKGLFARGEINIVRPYTYSHGEAYISNGIANLNYGNYAQALAHPTGANFAEGIAEVRYAKGRFSAKGIVFLTKKGLDYDSISMGGDIYKSYALRSGDYGIKFLQGELTNIQTYNVEFSYLINPKFNMMLKTGFWYRKEKKDNYFSENRILYLGISSDIFNSLLN